MRAFSGLCRVLLAQLSDLSQAPTPDLLSEALPALTHARARPCGMQGVVMMADGSPRELGFAADRFGSLRLCRSLSYPSSMCTGYGRSCYACYTISAVVSGPQNAYGPHDNFPACIYGHGIAVSACVMGPTCTLQGVPTMESWWL